MGLMVCMANTKDRMAAELPWDEGGLTLAAMYVGTRLE